MAVVYAVLIVATLVVALPFLYVVFVSLAT